MKTCLFGLVGMSIGAALFMGGIGQLRIWLAWLIAPLLWYLGFGMVMAWALACLFAAAHDGEQKDTMIGPSTNEPGIARWAPIKQDGNMSATLKSEGVGGAA